MVARSGGVWFVSRRIEWSPWAAIEMSKEDVGQSAPGIEPPTVDGRVAPRVPRKEAAGDLNVRGQSAVAAAAPALACSLPARSLACCWGCFAVLFCFAFRCAVYRLFCGWAPLAERAAAGGSRRCRAEPTGLSSLVCARAQVLASASGGGEGGSAAEGQVLQPRPPVDGGPVPPPQGPKKVMNPHDKKLRQLIWDCWTRIIDDADCSNDLSGLNSTAALPTLNLICDATGVKGNNRVAFCRRWIGRKMENPELDLTGKDPGEKKARKPRAKITKKQRDAVAQAAAKVLRPPQ